MGNSMSESERSIDPTVDLERRLLEFVDERYPELPVGYGLLKRDAERLRFREFIAAFIQSEKERVNLLTLTRSGE